MNLAQTPNQRPESFLLQQRWWHWILDQIQEVLDRRSCRSANRLLRKPLGRRINGNDTRKIRGILFVFDQFIFWRTDLDAEIGVLREAKREGRYWWAEAIGGAANVRVDRDRFDAVTQPLWAWLDRVRPHLWRSGESYPASGPALHQLLDDGEVDISMAFNPAEASSLILAGRLPLVTIDDAEAGASGGCSGGSHNLVGKDREATRAILHWIRERS